MADSLGSRDRSSPRKPPRGRAAVGGSSSGGSASGMRSRGAAGGDRRGAPPSGDRRGSAARSGEPARDARPPRPARPRSTAGGWRRDDLPAEARTEVQRRYDGPPIPEDITGKELDRTVANQLKSLPEKLGVRVARHLVAAGRLLDSDPQTAYEHTVAARARAARVSIVREACGEAAYAAGNFKDALTELKAARRMSGTLIYLPMMADCERALGRPERAIVMAKDPVVETMDETGQVEMRIVESGARRDLGDTEAAVRALDTRELRSRTRADWSPRLRYAYAEALLADGQRELAREWFERAEGVDVNDVTDAADRVAELDAERRP